MAAAATMCACGSGNARCAVWPMSWTSIDVHHRPPGTSTWNRIEHRLFAFISMNWRATPLVSDRVIVDLISATTTKTGLSVRCELDPTAYLWGIAISDAGMQALNLVRDSFH